MGEGEGEKKRKFVLAHIYDAHFTYRCGVKKKKDFEKCIYGEIA